MVNYNKILKSQVFFFSSIFLMIIMSMIITPFVTILTNTLGYEFIKNIVDFLLILVYIILALVLPLIYSYTGITERDDNNNVIKIVISIFVSLIMIVLTYFGWFMVEGIANSIDDGFILMLFWLGFFGSWLLNVLVLPMYVIITTMNSQN